MSDKSLAWLRVIVSLVAYVLACAAFVALQDRGQFAAILAIFAVGLLGIRLHRVARDEFRKPEVDPRLRWVLIGVVAGAGLLALLAWQLGVRNGAGFFGLALFYVGAGLGLAQLRAWSGDNRLRFGLVLAGTLALTLGSLVIVAFGGRWALRGVLAGLVLVPIGVALVSEVVLRRLGADPERGRRDVGLRWSIGLALAGVVLLAGGLVALDLVGTHDPYVVIVGGGALLLMLGLAARSNVDAVFVVLAAAVVWTLGHQSVPVPASLEPEPDDAVVVALGDSYISGEGADEFYEGTNTEGVNTCRRAPTAYPPLLMLERDAGLPDHLAFLACSGAKAPQVAVQAQEAATLVGGADDDVEVVLVSAGGNDALFGTLGQACLLPIDCTRLAAAWEGNLDHVRTTLGRAYADIREALPGVPVVVVPYPVPVADHGCSYSAFSDREHAFLADFAARLDATVAGAAADAGFYVVETMPQALAGPGLRLCDRRAGEVGVNLLATNTVFGTLEESVNPKNWVHNSLHPNARGHEAMRSTLVAWLADHPDLQATAPADGAALAAPAGGATAGPCLGREGAALDACAQRWMARESAQHALAWGWLLVPILVGAWLIALQFLRLWWAVFGTPPTGARPATAARSEAGTRVGAGAGVTPPGS